MKKVGEMPDSEIRALKESYLLKMKDIFPPASDTVGRFGFCMAAMDMVVQALKEHTASKDATLDGILAFAMQATQDVLNSPDKRLDS